MFEPLYDALASVMNFFYTLVPNYGFAIMGLTVVVMVVITPLTVKSTRSMLEMQRLQPEMKRIQEKYKNDREKLNAELMAFYKEHKINPLGGCLPLLAQMPVFFIMYELMRGLTVRAGGAGSGVGQIAGQAMTGAKLTPWVMTDQVFEPEHLNKTSDMYQALNHTSTMNFLGMDLSLSVTDALRIGLLVAIPFVLLLVIMLITGLVQNRQLQARNTNANVNPQQQMIMKFMPFFLPVISIGFPAGLSLYWCTQNLCRIGTNQYITHNVYAKHHKDEPIDAKSSVKTSEAKSSAKQVAAESNKQAKAKSDKATAATGGSKNAGSKNAGSKNGDSKKSPGKDSSDGRAPGKSVRSQKAHEKASESGAAGSSKRRTSGQRRRSGDRRR